MEAEGLDMVAGLAEALKVKGVCLYHLIRLEETLETLGQAQALYQSIRDEANTALVQMDTGLAYESMGRFEEAERAYTHCLEYFRGKGDQLRLASVLNNVGVVHHIMGNYEQAWELLSEGLEHARRSGYAPKEALILTSIGDLYTDLDVQEAARDAYYQAREIAERTQEHFLRIYLVLAQARLALSGEDVGLATYLLQIAGELIRKDTTFEHALHSLTAGRVSQIQERYTEAIEHLQTAASFFSKGQPFYGAQAHFVLAQSLFADGQDKEARAALREAFRLIPDLGQHVLVPAARTAGDLLDAAATDPELTYRVENLRKKVSAFEQMLPGMRRFLRQRALPSITFGPPQLVVKALGGEEVWLDGKQITIGDWQTRTARDLFFLLLAHPEGMTKEAIGVEIWPDADPGQLKTRFKNAIYRVRRALGQDVIQFGEDHVYSFNWTMDYKYDAQAFEHTVEQAERETRVPKKMSLYESALGLYSGEFLPGLDQEWVAPLREHMRQLHAGTMLHVAQYHLEHQEFRNALQWSAQLLEQDPCQEEAHRLAMQAYAGLGNRSGVARQFQLCREALWEQIQVPPSPQTQSLYERLLQ
jgi:DNA-binding SARP family transcriptional activator/Flp pilus assembly protein TadD